MLFVPEEKILLPPTKKKTSKEVVAERGQRLKVPYTTEIWFGRVC